MVRVVWPSFSYKPGPKKRMEAYTPNSLACLEVATSPHFSAQRFQTAIDIYECCLVAIASSHTTHTLFPCLAFDPWTIIISCWPNIYSTQHSNSQVELYDTEHTAIWGCIFIDWQLIKLQQYHSSKLGVLHLPCQTNWELNKPPPVYRTRLAHCTQPLPFT